MLLTFFPHYFKMILKRTFYGSRLGLPIKQRLIATLNAKLYRTMEGGEDGIVFLPSITQTKNSTLIKSQLSCILLVRLRTHEKYLFHRRCPPVV